MKKPSTPGHRCVRDATLMLSDFICFMNITFNQYLSNFDQLTPGLCRTITHALARSSFREDFTPYGGGLS